jgi:hypothetical protein
LGGANLVEAPTHTIHFALKTGICLHQQFGDAAPQPYGTCRAAPTGTGLQLRTPYVHERKTTRIKQLQKTLKTRRQRRAKKQIIRTAPLTPCECDTVLTMLQSLGCSHCSLKFQQHRADTYVQQCAFSGGIL